MLIEASTKVSDDKKDPCLSKGEKMHNRRMVGWIILVIGVIFGIVARTMKGDPSFVWFFSGALVGYGYCLVTSKS